MRFAALGWCGVCVCERERETETETERQREILHTQNIIRSDTI